ncbi:ATP-binding protein [Actinoplanes sp. L3-i22]|uniref:ATP-binding protein n=1 Tax=Actinoplanes sp. L3-i22 TaxID=2836373 RepID=UPI001C7805DB|nr:ATP-binding protein [Actinoplanes sp. L3-i22]BCY12706.1 hypothetical protein L3i22_077940 [Actinoplanes sp. L3-i22]
MTTGYRRPLARTVAFALLYAAAVYSGRRTAMVGDGVSLIWPAAGVGVVWFCANRTSPTRRLDAVLLVLILGLGNWLTGAPAAVSVVAGFVGLIQAGIFLGTLRRWRPNLWGAGGSETLRSPRDLWGLLGATLAASVGANLVSLLGRGLVTGSFPVAFQAMALARHTASILIIGAAGIYLGAGLRRWRARPPLRRVSFWRTAEIAGIFTFSVGGHVGAFAYDHRLPLSFALLGLTVLVGTRLRTPWVLVHNSVISAIAVQYTLLGSGPFAQVGDVGQRAVIVQLFVLLVALVGLALALGRDERTALLSALAEEKAELDTQKTLLTAVIDSMADGLAVIGGDGRVTLRNPAVTELLGRCGPDDLLGGPGWDGEPAYLRALAGEDVRGVDMPVRNPGVPEGRVVRVTATVLPHPDGTRSAVVLFHDVTAERRHRDELTNFAGVVAHDLLNPLAAIEGWTAATLDSLDGVPDHPNLDQAHADLARLTRASARMRGLIDGLLAYTTAREATVAPAPVDLTEVVADIAQARADAAVAAGSPEPRFRIGALPPVQADPVLVRQLVDNLVGNAIKYTAPGVVPALHISAASAGGMVTVRIVDNGIGIPAGQHDAIFGNFHRAHTTGAYLGTGLGLAICKRIVERHGGDIAAVDHPGGGSCFVFSLPAAVADHPYLTPV